MIISLMAVSSISFMVKVSNFADYSFEMVLFFIFFVCVVILLIGLCGLWSQFGGPVERGSSGRVSCLHQTTSSIFLFCGQKWAVVSF